MADPSGVGHSHFRFILINVDLSRNKRVHFDYNVLEKFEAGIVLTGFETKAVKDGRFNLGGSYVIIRSNEAWLINADIPAYQPKNAPKGYEQTKTRKLLLTQKEIKYLTGKTETTGLTIIPLHSYLKNSRVKLEIGLVKHKKKEDKREGIKKRETEREIRRVMKVR